MKLGKINKRKNELCDLLVHCSDEVVAGRQNLSVLVNKFNLRRRIALY